MWAQTMTKMPTVPLSYNMVCVAFQTLRQNVDLCKYCLRVNMR